MGCFGCGGRPQKVHIPEMPSATPRLESDGSIRYPEGEEVDVIQGYDPDPDDPLRLIPQGAGCMYRITGIMLDKDGTYIPHHVCRNNQCEHRTKSVTFSICDECPLRE